MAVYFGTNGNDSLDGTSEVDTIYGRAGDDSLYGLLSGDTLFGGQGNDFLYGAEGGDELRGSTGEDSLFGEGGDDTGRGGEGDDFIEGGSGNDILNGDTGTDTLAGGLGDDTLRVDTATDLLIELAGEGNDLVVATASFTLPSDAGGTGKIEELQLIGSDNLAAGGNEIDNIITGNVSANALRGFAGSDTLNGLQGNDTLFGGDDNDRLVGKNGLDYLSGGSGDDTALAGLGADTVYGGVGEDRVFGQRGDDHVFGEEDDDALFGGNDRDHLYGGLDNDTLQGRDGNDVLEGGSGQDRVFDNTGDATAFGGSGEDWLRGRDDNDTLYGDDGDDRVDGGTGQDLGYGGSGSDSLRGELGDDSLYGDDGDDTLGGGDGLDTLAGGSGSDQQFGGSGDDRLIAGSGMDHLSGGSGCDTAVFEGNIGDATFAVNGSGESVVITADDGENALDSIETLVFDDGDVLVVGGGSKYVTIQSAIDAATAGDTVLVLAGSYNEVVAVNKQLTILGNKAGVDGDDAGRGTDESVVDGGFNVTANGVTFDGLMIKDGSNIGGSDTGLFLAADDATITNMLFERSGPFGEFRAIVTTFGSDESGMMVTASKFTGWATGIFSNTDGDFTVTGNHFEDNFVGMSADFPTLPGSIDANDFVSNDFEDLGIGLNAATFDLSDIYGTANNFTGGGVPEISAYALNNGVAQTFFGSDNDDQMQRLGTGAVAFSGGLGDDSLIGGSVGDSLGGGSGADELRGNDGDDRLVGGSGDDSILGGTGTDTAVMPGNIADATFESSGGDMIVTTADGGTDTLNGVEVLAFDDGDVLVVGADGFATIQAAVDAASTGDTILVLEGSYSESVVVDVAVSFIGVGEVVVTSPDPSGSAFDIDGDLGAGNTLSFDGIDFVGSDRSGISFGSGDVLGTLEVRNAHFEANDQNGLEVVDGAGLGNVIVTDSSFVGNGQPSLSSGDGDILLYQYNGDATLQNLTIEGKDRGSGAQENGIQLRSDTGSLGNVLIDNVQITGIFEKQPIAIFNYDDVDGLMMQDVTITADSIDYNTAINIAGIGGDLDLSDLARFSNIDVSGAGPGDVIAVQGDAANNSFTGATANDFLRGFGGDDELSGGLADDGLVGDDGDDSLSGDAGADTAYGGSGQDAIEGGDGDDHLSGDSGLDILFGGSGADTGFGGLGQDSLSGGEGGDVLRGDGTLTDIVPSYETDFSEFDLGAIANGENSWVFNGGAADQGIVDIGGPNGKVFKMSSDPDLPNFSGPYSAALARPAGEPQTTAEVDTIRISYDFMAVSAAPDSSRLEVDFGHEDATDRANFLVIEWEAGVGLRIAVNEPLTDGSWTTNTFDAFTGNRTLVDGLDGGGAQWHNLEMVLRFVDGQDNDVIDIFLDGSHIGTTTTFENYRDFHDPTTSGNSHLVNAEGEITSRIFFRPSAGNGGVTDGPNGDNQGFYFDNLQIASYNSGSLHGDSLSGGSGADSLLGEIGDDVLDGGDDVDALYGGDGADSLDGGDGNDLQDGGIGDDHLVAGSGDDSLLGGAGTDTAIFTGNVADATFTTSASGDAIVTTNDDGTDSLNSVEVLSFDDGDVLVVGGNSAFVTIQSAVDAATAGDTILVLAGSYNEVVAVNKQLTILGNQAGVDGDDAGRGTDESVVDGGFNVTANGVTFDGLMIKDGTNIGGSDTGMFLAADDATITNMLFERTGPFGEFRAIVTTFGSDESGMMVTASKFTGWATGIFSNTDGDFTVTGNHFEDNFVGMSADFPTLPGSVDANDFVSNDFEDLGIGLNAATFDLSDIYGTANNFTGGGIPEISAYALNNGVAQTFFGSDNDDQMQRAGTGAVDFSGALGDDSLIGGSVGDSLGGGSGADELRGNDGDDHLVGGSGDDSILGGTGTDTAVMPGNIADATFESSGGDMIVTTADGGTDTLNGVEVLAFDDGDVLVVGADSEFLTIQSAVDAATAGDTIVVLAGSYNELVTVDKSLTLLGEGDGSDPASSTIVVGNGKTGPGNGSGRIFSVNADDVTISGMRIQDGDRGVELGNGFSNFALTDSTILNTDIGIRTASFVQFDGITIDDSTFDGNDYGIYFANDGNTSRIQNVDVTDTSFLNNLHAALYAETLETGNFTNITATDNASGNANGIVFDFWSAYSTSFSDITFDTVQLTNPTTPATNAAFRFEAFGAATVSDVTIENSAVEDAAVALFSNKLGAVTWTANTLDDISDFGTRGRYNAGETVDGDFLDDDNRDRMQAFGESAHTFNGLSASDQLAGASGADHLYGGVGDDKLYGVGNGDFLFGGDDDDQLYGGDGLDTLAGGSGSDQQFGGSGDDRLIAGSGMDHLSGGSGCDTAVFEGNIGDATFAVNGSGESVVITADDGENALDSIETLVFDDSDVLVVGGGSKYVTIQSGVDAATAGDTILVLAGSYNEVVAVNKQLTILGNQAGVDGDDAGRGTDESVVDGGFNVTANGVTFDGLMIKDGTNIGGSDTGLFLAADDATITNMLFERSGPFGEFRGIVTTFGSDESGMTVTASKFTGWATGIFSNTDGDFTVTGNHFEGNFVGMSADFPTLPGSVDANDFVSNDFEDLGIGLNAATFDLSDIYGTANNFTGGIVPEISAYALNNGVAQTFFGSDNDDQMQRAGTGAVDFSGGLGDDTLFGSNDSDVLRGGAGNDVMEAHGGNDFLFVSGTGDNTLTGGTSADSFRFQDNEGTQRITDFDPTVVGENIGIQINVNGTGITSFADLAGRLSQGGGNVTLDLSQGSVTSTVVLEGVADTSLLSSDDFVFFF